MPKAKAPKAKAPKAKNIIRQDYNAEMQKLKDSISALQTSNAMFSFSPSSLFGNIVQQELTTRDIELRERYAMYEDSFTQGIIETMIMKSIGASQNDDLCFEIVLDEEGTGLPDFMIKEIINNIKYISRIIDESLVAIATDAMFLGDGYSKIMANEKEGVVKLVHNPTTKAFYICPIVTNHGDTKAYMVENYGFFGKTGVSGRVFLSTDKIARMNAPSNGLDKMNTEHLTQFQNMLAFKDEETYYQDIITGGVVEGCYNDFKSFEGAINALSNTRRASAIIERFVTQNLGQASIEDRDMLKKAFEEKIRVSASTLNKKMRDKSSEPAIITHYIPTTGDNATGGIQIQESSPSFEGLKSVEDIMFNIKKYVGSLGFNFAMTPFGDQSQGGMAKEDYANNSLIMEAEAVKIRKMIREYILGIFKTHMLYKYNVAIKDEFIQVNFLSVINHSKQTAEMQRMENITNTQQVIGIIEQFKAMALEDNEGNRFFLKNQIIDLLPQNTEDRPKQVDAIIDIIMTPPPKEEEI